MKKAACVLAVTAFLFSMNVNAQQAPKAKKSKARTEASAAAATPAASGEKKSCSPASGKKGCCAHKEEARS